MGMDGDVVDLYIKGCLGCLAALVVASILLGASGMWLLMRVTA